MFVHLIISVSYELWRGKQRRIISIVAKTAFSCVVFQTTLHYTMDCIVVREHCELMAPPLCTNGYVSNTGARKHIHINRRAHVLYTHLPVRDERGE